MLADQYIKRFHIDLVLHQDSEKNIVKILWNYRVINVLLYLFFCQIERLLQSLFTDSIDALDVFLENKNIVWEAAVNEAESFRLGWSAALLSRTGHLFHISHEPRNIAVTRQSSLKRGSVDRPRSPQKKQSQTARVVRGNTAGAEVQPLLHNIADN